MSFDQENPIPEPNSTPAIPQEPTPEVPITPSISEQVEVSPVVPESPKEADGATPVNNPSDAEAIAGKNIKQVEPTEDIPTVTAQIPVIEPFDSTHDKPFAKQSLLVKAREAIQFRKRKKLEKIMRMFLKQASITNDEVEKLLHVSDATATRYLEQLEKEGKVRQNGRTGKNTYYEKI